MEKTLIKKVKKNIYKGMVRLMNKKKIKELWSNKKVMIGTITLVGLIAIGSVGYMMDASDNKEAKKDNKVLAVEKENSNISENTVKTLLDKLKLVDISKLTEDEKKALETKIKGIEDMIKDKDYVKAKKEIELVTKDTESKVKEVAKKDEPKTEEKKKVEDKKKFEDEKKETVKEDTSNKETSNNSNTSSGGNKQENKPVVNEKPSNPVVNEKPNKPADTHTHSWVEQFQTVNHQEQGHYEDVLVSAAWSEQIPVYETQGRAICNGCKADITADPGAHMKEALLAGNEACGAWTGKYVDVQVGTETVNHEAVYDKKYVVDKAAWTENIVSGYKCSSCGATKQ